MPDTLTKTEKDCVEKEPNPRDPRAPGERWKGIEIVKQFLDWLGMDTENEGLKGTPRRVVDSWLERTQGYYASVDSILGVTFDADCDEMVTLKNIAFHSTCEHHLLPFSGTAHVGYIPGCEGRVVGISKLARIVEVYARRLQIQERMSAQIADSLVQHLEPIGVAVVVEATHLCMVCRGVQKAGATMRTTALRGVFKDDASARAEFLEGLR
jgi:GTP cyclohydrolase I